MQARIEVAAMQSLHDEPGFALWDAPCAARGPQELRQTNHRVRYLHRMPGGRLPGLDCDQPMLLVCDDCPARTAARCNAHRASKCLTCSERYRRLLVRVADSGYRSDGSLYFLTLTAPGEAAHGMWDPGFIRGTRPDCDCHNSLPLGEWNASAGRRWNRLRTALRRHYPQLEFFRAAELQERNALHHHLIVWTPEGSPVVDVLLVQRLALEAGYGCNTDLAPIVAGSRQHTYYVAKYVTKACDDRDDMPWVIEVVDQDSGEVRRMQSTPTFRTWSRSHGFGVSMKAVRANIRSRAAARSWPELDTTTDQLAASQLPIPAAASPPI